MSHKPHKLTDEFPEYRALIGHLKEVDGHFARLAEKYGAVNQQIVRAEKDSEFHDDPGMADMLKSRMMLKDEIYGMLVRHEPVAEALG